MNSKDSSPKSNPSETKSLSLSSLSFESAPPSRKLPSPPIAYYGESKQGKELSQWTGEEARAEKGKRAEAASGKKDKSGKRFDSEEDKRMESGEVVEELYEYEDNKHPLFRLDVFHSATGTPIYSRRHRVSSDLSRQALWTHEAIWQVFQVFEQFSRDAQGGPVRKITLERESSSLPSVKEVHNRLPFSLAEPPKKNLIGETDGRVTKVLSTALSRKDPEWTIIASCNDIVDLRYSEPLETLLENILKLVVEHQPRLVMTRDASGVGAATIGAGSKSLGPASASGAAMVVDRKATFKDPHNKLMAQLIHRLVEDATWPGMDRTSPSNG